MNVSKTNRLWWFRARFDTKATGGPSPGAARGGGDLRTSQMRLARRSSLASGFTLVEMLVVTGVIGVLAGLLLPAVTRARSCAGRARCVQNVRQLGVAAQLYWDDHAGNAFAERTVRTNGGWAYWFGWLADGAESQRAFDPARGALWPYLGANGVSACPALDTRVPHFKGKARGASSGYGYNLHLGPRNGPPVNMGQIAHPSDLAVFADCAQVNDFLAPASADHPMLEEFYYFDTNALSATVHFRHRGRAAAGFADGHVQHVIPDAGSEDRRLQGQLLGRLPASMLRP